MDIQRIIPVMNQTLGEYWKLFCTSLHIIAVR